MKVEIRKDLIKGIVVKEDALIMYSAIGTFVCELDSKREISHNTVEFTLKGKSENNGKRY